MKRSIALTLIAGLIVLALSGCATPYVESQPAVDAGSSGDQPLVEEPEVVVVPNEDEAAAPEAEIDSLAPVSKALSPLISAEVGEDGSVAINLGFYNYDTTDFETTAFGASYRIVAEDGTVVAEDTVDTVEAVAAMSSAFPVAWTGELAPGTYRVEWSAPDLGSLLAMVVIGEAEGVLTVDDVQERATSDFPLPEDMVIPQ